MYYTKYRPQTFSEISKPNETAKALSNQVKEGKTAHAYLFVGSRGTGKTTTARILAKALNCKEISKQGDPCGKCNVCKSVQNGSFLDLIEIDAASNRGIDDIRSLRDKIKLAPNMGSKKVYIVDEVHMLTTEAFNALLKTLEEPPSHAVFILCTTESHKVPETIKSRCMVFNFKRATISQLVEKLGKICEQEGVEVVSSLDKKEEVTGKGNKAVTKDELKQIAVSAHGGYRDAETLLQQVVEGELDVNSFVSSNAENTYAEFTSFLVTCEVNSALLYVNKLFEDGFDLYAWSVGLVGYLRDLLFISADAYQGLIDVSPEVFSKMEEQAAKFDSGRVVELIEAFMGASARIKSQSIPQLPLELALVNLCHQSSSKIVEKIQDSKDVEEALEVMDLPSSVSAEIEEISQKWEMVIKEAKPYNHSVSALLKSTKPIAIEEDSLILEVYYAFHKERLESTKNMEILHKALTAVFGSPMRVKCNLSKEKPQKLKKNETGELTDLNIQIPSKNGATDKGSLLDVLDGGLPL